jgi:hypothetical protein
MTDPSTISPEQAAAASPGQAAIEVTRQFFKFASDHYVIFSALTIIAVVFVCTVFTFGCLSGFDSRLILVLEYTDVLKAGFAAAAIF